MFGQRWLAPLLVGYCILALGGCRALESEEVSEIGPFPESANSLTDVGERIVGGLIVGEPAVLGELRLSRQEYVEVVWPELPASNPDLNVPVEHVWADIEARNRSALIRLQPQFEGLAAELKDVACRGEVQECGTFRVVGSPFGPLRGSGAFSSSRTSWSRERATSSFATMTVCSARSMQVDRTRLERLPLAFAL